MSDTEIGLFDTMYSCRAVRRITPPKGTYERIIGLPKGVLLAAVIPVGYPKGRFGPVTRPPARSFISWDRFQEPTGRRD